MRTLLPAGCLMRAVKAGLPGVHIGWSSETVNLPTYIVQEVRPKIRMGVTGQVDVRKPDTRPKLVSLSVL